MSENRPNPSHLSKMDEKQLELYYRKKARKYQKKIQMFEKMGGESIGPPVAPGAKKVLINNPLMNWNKNIEDGIEYNSRQKRGTDNDSIFSSVGQDMTTFLDELYFSQQQLQQLVRSTPRLTFRGRSQVGNVFHRHLPIPGNDQKKTVFYDFYEYEKYYYQINQLRRGIFYPNKPFVFVSGLAYDAFQIMIECLQFGPRQEASRESLWTNYLYHEQIQSIINFRKKVLQEKNLISEIRQFQNFYNMGGTQKKFRLQGFSHENLILYRATDDFFKTLDDFYHELDFLKLHPNKKESYKEFRDFFKKFFYPDVEPEDCETEYLAGILNPGQTIDYNKGASEDSMENNIFRHYRMFRGVTTLQAYYKTNRFQRLKMKLKLIRNRLAAQTKLPEGAESLFTSTILSQIKQLVDSTVVPKLNSEQTEMTLKNLEDLENIMNAKTETTIDSELIPDIILTNSMYFEDLPLVHNKKYLLHRSKLCSLRFGSNEKVYEMFSSVGNGVLRKQINNLITPPLIIDGSIQPDILLDNISEPNVKPSLVNILNLNSNSEMDSKFLVKTIESKHPNGFAGKEKLSQSEQRIQQSLKDNLEDEVKFLKLLGSTSNSNPKKLEEIINGASYQAISQGRDGNSTIATQPILIYVSPGEQPKFPEKSGFRTVIPFDEVVSKTKVFWNNKFSNNLKEFETEHFVQNFVSLMQDLKLTSASSKGSQIKTIYDNLEKLLTQKTENVEEVLKELISNSEY